MVALVGLGVTPAAAAEPELGLRAEGGLVELQRRRSARPVWFAPNVFVTAQNSPFELRVGRESYTDPIELNQEIEDGPTVALDPALLDGWSGLKNFLKVVVRNSNGKVVQQRSVTFCPNSYEAERVNDEGPGSQTYPEWCGGGPFVKGMVWGIDEGWAARAFGWEGIMFDGPDGRYRVSVSIAPKYTEIFDVDSSATSAHVNVKVKTVKRSGGGCHHCKPPGFRSFSESDEMQQSAAVPDMGNPAPSLLPDLVSLPAWGMDVRRQRKQDFLRFAATVWVGGASGLHVEGFRRPSQDVMDAYQYFYQDGEIVGRAPVGTFEFDDRRGHTHWHFRQFAEYRIVDASNNQVVKSTKEAFCLVPTDAIDLSLEGAQWRPDHIGFAGSACGHEGSLWVKEVLPLGWGDTYMQSRPGQSFNVTDLPNGTYFIEVEANPGGNLHDGDPGNNVERRKIKLRGKPGARFVKVPPWNGIDTEGWWDQGFMRSLHG